MVFMIYGVGIYLDPSSSVRYAHILFMVFHRHLCRIGFQTRRVALMNSDLLKIIKTQGYTLP